MSRPSSDVRATWPSASSRGCGGSPACGRSTSPAANPPRWRRRWPRVYSAARRTRPAPGPAASRGRGLSVVAPRAGADRTHRALCPSHLHRIPARAMTFKKWQALGNDYVIVEERAVPFELTPERVRRLCAAHTGIGSDGVLLLRRAGWIDHDAFAIETAAGEIRPQITGPTTCTLDMGRARLRSPDYPS